MRDYIFFRWDGSSVYELNDDLSARQWANASPGVIRVEDGNGRVVWRPGHEVPRSKSHSEGKERV